jgi:hypothetical protein
VRARIDSFCLQELKRLKRCVEALEKRAKNTNSNEQQQPDFNVEKSPMPETRGGVGRRGGAPAQATVGADGEGTAGVVTASRLSMSAPELPGGGMLYNLWGSVSNAAGAAAESVNNAAGASANQAKQAAKAGMSAASDAAGSAARLVPSGGGQNAPTDGGGLHAAGAATPQVVDDPDTAESAEVAEQNLKLEQSAAKRNSSSLLDGLQTLKVSSLFCIALACMLRSREKCWC